MKTCNNCGKTHSILEIQHKSIGENEGGVWFQCDCGSTLLFSMQSYIKLIKKMASDAVKRNDYYQAS